MSGMILSIPIIATSYFICLLPKSINVRLCLNILIYVFLFILQMTEQSTTTMKLYSLCTFFVLFSLSSIHSSSYHFIFPFDIFKLFLCNYANWKMSSQRSGKRPVDNPIPWRADSALTDRGNNGEDLTGGWYDGLYFLFVFFTK
jgi:hypothetical protein